MFFTVDLLVIAIARQFEISVNILFSSDQTVIFISDVSLFRISTEYRIFEEVLKNLLSPLLLYLVRIGC